MVKELYFYIHPTHRAYLDVLYSYIQALRGTDIKIVDNIHDVPTNAFCLATYSSDTPIMPRRVIILNYDRISFTTRQFWLDLCKSSKEVHIIDFCYNKRHVDFFNSLDFVQSYHVIPLGYVDPPVTLTAILEPQTDAVFFGYLTPRRKKAVKYIADNLPPHISFRVYDSAYGDKKKELVASSFIIVSIQSYDDNRDNEINDLARMALPLSLGKHVVGEYGGDSVVEPLLSNYVTFVDTYKQIPTAIEQLLHLRDCDRLAHRGCDIANQFKHNFPFERMVNTTLNEITQK